MQLKFDYNNMMEFAIGKHGIKDADLKKGITAMQKAFAEVSGCRGKGWQEWTELPFASESELAEIEEYCGKVRKEAESFVIFGIGGSALGPLSVAKALLHFRHNELSKEKRNAPKYYVEDNVDPERMNALLDVIDLKTTYFNVITKSGETSETLAQFLILYDLLKKSLGDAEAKKRIIVTTTLGKGSLYAIAQTEGFQTFGIGEGVGGRFSIFSSVGLVSLCVLGIDIRGLLAGAKAMSEVCLKENGFKNPALLTAFLQVLSMKKGKNISVMMPYSDALRYMADFYCQLWGESLGKAVDKNGKTVFTGQTPAKSLGVTDQHSQIQLYTEGPFDKVVSFIVVESFRHSVTIPSDDSIESCGFLKTQTMNNLINYEMRATRYALKKAGRSNFTIILPQISAKTIGELLQYFMYQTAFAGALLNVDTYNQPGVEEGKKATFAYLGRQGYEDKLAELDSSLTKEGYTI